jgi:hypothetical protein
MPCTQNEVLNTPVAFTLSLIPDHNLLQFLNTDLFSWTCYSLLLSPSGVPWTCINTVHYRTHTQVHIQ